MRNVHFAASVNSLDRLNLGAAVARVHSEGATELLLSAGDGRFGPDLGLDADTVFAITSHTSFPCGVHLIAAEPDRLLPAFVEAGASLICVHYEAVTHIHRTLGAIRELGLKAGIALCPGTPLTKLTYLFELVDRVLLLAHEPGAKEGACHKGLYDRVELLRRRLDYDKSPTQIWVKGPLTPEEAGACILKGTDGLVVTAEGFAEYCEAVRCNAAVG